MAISAAYNNINPRVRVSLVESPRGNRRIKTSQASGKQENHPYKAVKESENYFSQGSRDKGSVFFSNFLDAQESQKTILISHGLTI